MIISYNLLFTCDNYMNSTIYSTNNYHLFLLWRMLYAEVIDRGLSFAHMMSLYTLLYSAGIALFSKVIFCFIFLCLKSNLVNMYIFHK